MLLKNYAYTLDGKIKRDEVINTSLKPLLDYIQGTIDQYKKYGIPLYIINELSLYVEFLKNNIEILKHNNVFKEPEPVQVTINAPKDVSRDIINRLSSDQNIKSKDQLDALINKYLKEGKLSVLDIRIIQKRRKDLYDDN